MALTLHSRRCFEAVFLFWQKWDEEEREKRCHQCVCVCFGLGFNCERAIERPSGCIQKSAICNARARKKRKIGNSVAVTKEKKSRKRSRERENGGEGAGVVGREIKRKSYYAYVDSPKHRWRVYVMHTNVTTVPRTTDG